MGQQGAGREDALICDLLSEIGCALVIPGRGLHRKLRGVGLCPRHEEVPVSALCRVEVIGPVASVQNHVKGARLHVAVELREPKAVIDTKVRKHLCKKKGKERERNEWRGGQ